MQTLIGQIRAAANTYNLIEEGDKIAVGVSGGKDSLVLLYALSKLKEYHDKSFEVVAIAVDPQFNNEPLDYSKIEKLCEELCVPLIIRRTQLSKVIFEERKEKNPCSLCAKMRRGILHNMCKELSCNKLALGHHLDDAAETFVMNLYYGGNVSCFAPKTYLSRKDLTLIRPMIFCEEKDVAKAARKYELPITKAKCPVDGDTKREETKNYLKNLEKQIPDIRNKIIGAMQRGNISGWGKNETIL